MTTLLLLLPPRARLRAQGRDTGGADASPRSEPAREFDYLLSADGQQVSAQGRASAAALPRADHVVALVAEADLSWHRVQLPRAGRNKLRAALAGLMEEALLDEAETLHFAIEPDAAPGEQAWVAVVQRRWLQTLLAPLEQAHLVIDRLLPLSWPDARARGHFEAQTDSAGAGDGPESPVLLSWSHGEGAARLPLAGSLARDLFPPSLVQAARWTGSPAVISQAERWLGTAVAPLGAAERALEALRSPWELRQFELAPRTRGLQALRQLWRGLLGRSWQPVRWGVAALLLVQLLGLNLWAWQQRRAVDERRAALESTLRSTFPQVRAVLDAPVQMQREIELLRASAGRAGDQDFETLLAAAASAWPAERGPIDSFSFETGRLVIAATGWSEPQIEQFRQALDAEGWRLDSSGGRLSLSRASSQ